LTLLPALAGCGGADQPFSLVGDKPPSTPSGPGAGPSGPVEGCFVQFKSLIQLKLSANPEGDPLEVLDANPVDIPPIPIKVEGSKISISGDTFPEFILDRLSDQADLRVKGVPGAEGVGTYNAETGEMKIDGFKLSLEILEKGTEDLFLPGAATLNGVNFTTGSVNATGNLNPIAETGAPLNKDSRSLTLVVGLTLPNSFPQLSVLDGMIGGGALTASLDGVLDVVPESCGTGTPGSFPGDGVPQPAGLKVSIEDQVSISSIDFGASAAVLKNGDGQTVIDCLEASNRTMVSRLVTIANTGSEEKTLRFGQPQDSDFDRKAPLCGGNNEFVRGTISIKNGASCQSVVVGGKNFPIGDCTLPGAKNASISFPLFYLPFNYQDPGSGGAPVSDVGFFSFDYGAESPFTIQLKGHTVPDFRDVFAVSKILAGTESIKEVRNRGTVKIALDESAVLPFVQQMVLKNTGTDDWEEVSFTFEKGDVFSIDSAVVNRLPPADENNPGRMEWQLKFNPQGTAVNTDTLTIKMVKVGSITPETPQGIEARIVLNLLGTVGVPKLSGELRLRFDYLSALIDHIALDKPTESIDYRQIDPETAPEPVRLVFHDTAHEDIKEVEIFAPLIDVTDPGVTLAQRKRALRVFSSRATVGRNGERLSATDTIDKCDEPLDINRSYQAGDCSYFYYSILNAGKGLYDDETGHLTLPDIVLRFQNPYHADIIGKWPASNPFANPDYLMDTQLLVTFSTHILDRNLLEEGGRTIDLLPDDRVSVPELVVRSKPLGDPCPAGIFENTEPNFRCFLSTGERYLEGKAVTLRADQTEGYDVVIVGVGQFPSLIQDPELPWFLGEDGGTRIFISILGRIYKP
jgi:hypothetical protein